MEVAGCGSDAVACGCSARSTFGGSIALFVAMLIAVIRDRRRIIAHSSDALGAGSGVAGRAMGLSVLTYRAIAAIEPITRIDRSLDSRQLSIDQQSMH